MVLSPYFRKKLKAMDFPLTSIDYLEFLPISSDQLEDLFDGMNLDDWIDDVTDGKQDEAYNDGYQSASDEFEDKKDALEQEYQDKIESLADITIKPVKIKDIPTMTQFKQFVKGNLALGNYVFVEVEERYHPIVRISIDTSESAAIKDAFATKNHQAYLLNDWFSKNIPKIVKAAKDLDGTDENYKFSTKSPD